MNKFAPFANWLWTKKDVENAFRITTLTKDNSIDPTLPSPPLSTIESLTLFKHLEDLKLVYPHPDPEGGTAYLINKVKSSEWKMEISELKKHAWQKSGVWIGALKLIGIVFLGYLGR